MPSLDAHLLVASPHLEDSNFARTVVLIIQHSEEGAFGVVLNRPSRHSLAEVWRQVADDPCSASGPLHLGGPVEGPLLALHTRPTLAEKEVLPGVYFSAEREALRTLVAEPTEPFMIFSGYSGWGAGQLEHELKEGSWLTTPARLDYIFPPTDDNLWRTVARDIGRDILSTSRAIRHAPEDPSVN